MSPENARGGAAPTEASGPGTSLLRLDRFQRTGEMGRRIAEFDWKNTPLGALEDWPRSLQSTIAILLGSRYPMCLAWGKDLLLFYNDAYIGLLGAKHPEALGRSLRETLSELWDSIGAMVSAVMSTGVAFWVPGYGVPMWRHGYLEESYFSASCSEIPEQVVSERRTQLLREVAMGESHGPTETCEHLGRIVAEHPLDVPFVAFYLRSTDGDALELRGSAHLPASPVFPRRVAVADTCARRAAPLGVIVAAVSPARALDDTYRTFYELLVARVSTLIRNSIAFEAEHKRAEALAEIDRVKTAFFSNVSHELRTPLTLILGPIEDALAAPERSLRGEDLHAVHRSALRLRRLRSE